MTTELSLEDFIPVEKPFTNVKDIILQLPNVSAFQMHNCVTAVQKDKKSLPLLNL